MQRSQILLDIWLRYLISGEDLDICKNPSTGLGYLIGQDTGTEYPAIFSWVRIYFDKKIPYTLPRNFFLFFLLTTVR